MRPCDIGMCDPERCHDVDCLSGIESVPEKKEEESEDICTVTSEHPNEREK